MYLLNNDISIILFEELILQLKCIYILINVNMILRKILKYQRFARVIEADKVVELLALLNRNLSKRNGIDFNIYQFVHCFTPIFSHDKTTVIELQNKP